MPKPGKAVKRSVRAIERAAKSMGDRAEEAQSLLQQKKYTADKFAEHAAGQALDVVGLWMGLLGAGSDTRPEVFITITLPASGNQTGTGVIELDDPIDVSLVKSTDLISPNTKISSTNVHLTPVSSSDKVTDAFNVAVTVQHTQTKSLYSGLVTDGTSALGEIRVSIV